MPHTDTHQKSPGEQSEDQGREPSGQPRDAKHERASKEADTGAAPEQSDTKPETVNPKAKRQGPPQE